MPTTTKSSVEGEAPKLPGSIKPVANKDPSGKDFFLANVFTMGWAEFGRLGIGPVHPKNHVNPHPVMALHWGGEEARTLHDAGCGGKHTLFLLEDGSPFSCGDATHGQLGREVATGWDRYKDVELSRVAAGHMTSFAISKLGDVFSWGCSKFGVLGHKEEKEDDVPLPRLIDGLRYIQIVEVSTMGWHVLALSRDRRIFAWGRYVQPTNEAISMANDHGQCGQAKVSRCINEPVQIPFSKSERVIAVSAGWEHSIALLEVEKNTGKRQVVVFAWGKHANHRLGGCDARSHHSPRENLLLTAYITKKRIELKMIAAGGAHNLVLTTNGTCLAWGAGGYGQLGYGHLWDKAVPVRIQGLTGVVKVVAGLRHSLVLQENHEVWGWGWNGFGELGMGDESIKLQPQCMYAFKRAFPIGVYAGERHSCVATKGMAKMVKDEEEYKPYFVVMDETHPSGPAKNNLKQAMRAEGLDGDFLDSRRALLPGQPGMVDEDVQVDKEKYGYKWCVDTWARDTFLHKCTWPSRYVCKVCDMKQVCMACARRCHKGHGLTVYMTLRRKGDECDCKTSKTCVCRWSPLRHEFNKLAELDGEYIFGHHLRGLLCDLRFGKTFTVEDLEAAYSDLCLDETLGGNDVQKAINEAKIQWFAFEEWYVEYFTQKDAPPEVPDGFYH